MAIGANSYSSVEDVVALTRHLLDGKSTFDDTTVPTMYEVEQLIDDLSGMLNNAIAAAGFPIPITNATAKLACDIWVRSNTVAWVEMTQRGTGYDGDTNTNRPQWFMDLYGPAKGFVEEMTDGWINLGISQTNDASDGLTFTALVNHDNRTDPTVTTREQPLFRRRQWVGNSGIQ